MIVVEHQSQPPLLSTEIRLKARKNLLLVKLLKWAISCVQCFACIAGKIIVLWLIELPCLLRNRHSPYSLHFEWFWASPSDQMQWKELPSLTSADWFWNWINIDLLLPRSWIRSGSNHDNYQINTNRQSSIWLLVAGELITKTSTTKTDVVNFALV